MRTPQRVRDPCAQFPEFGFVPEVVCAWITERNIDRLDDGPRSCRHHQDLRGEIDRLCNGMRDEQARETLGPRAATLQTYSTYQEMLAKVRVRKKPLHRRVRTRLRRIGRR